MKGLNPVITAVIAGITTVLIVELFLRPNFPQIRQSLDDLAGVQPIIITG